MNADNNISLVVEFQRWWVLKRRFLAQFMGYQGWDKILMITLISSKKLGVYEIMRNTVVCTIVKCIANVLAK